MRSYFVREFSRIRKTTRWSLEGWLDTWRNEPSLHQWFVAGLISSGLTFLVDFTALERALIIARGILVLVVELLNTGIEAAVDHTGTDIHPLAKKAKDAASAAVMLSAITVLVTWVVLLLG